MQPDTHYPINDLVEHQTIAAVQAEDLLEDAIRGEPNVIFLITGSILNVRSMVERIHAAGKRVFLHLELVEGIAGDRSGIAYVARDVRPDGIITTRNSVVRMAKEQGLMAIQRIFLIDTNAISKGIRAVEQSQPDAIEVMPGIMPRIIRELVDRTPLPIIAGGLISTRQEIDEALEAGALAVSVGTSRWWREHE